MPGTPQFEVPDDLSLLEFFGSEPVEREDGLCFYEASDARGNVLRFSFDIFARSVQTELVSNECAHVVSHENASRLWIDASGIHADFTVTDQRTLMTVALAPMLRVHWSTIRVR